MTNRNTQLGKAIQDFRKSLNITQEELASKSNISYSTIAKIERGAISNPSVFSIASIAHNLNTNIDSLLSAAPKQSSSIKSQKIKFFYCDINGVLVRFFQKAFVNIAKDYHLSVDKVENAFWHFNDDANLGKMSPVEFDRNMSKVLNIENFTWQERYLEAIEPIRSMQKLLVNLSKEMEIGLLSNISNGLIERMVKLRILPDINYKAIIDSSEVHEIKPNAEIYRIAENRSGYRGGEILFVDDSRTNLTSAEKFGWHVLWFDDFMPEDSVERVKQALKTSNQR